MAAALVDALAIGDGANRQALAAIEEIAARYDDDRRWRIEHAQIVNPADLHRFGRNGIIASMQPVHQTSDRLMAEARARENGGAAAEIAGAVLRGATSTSPRRLDDGVVALLARLSTYEFVPPRPEEKEEERV